MESVPVLTSRASLVLDLPPSCVQFCPSHADYFVVGTYNLKQGGEGAEGVKGDKPDGNKSQSRNGSLLLFRIDGKALILVQALPLTSAVLDLCFHPAEGLRDMLAVVSSTGTLSIFRIDPAHQPDSPIVHLGTSRCQDLDEDTLLLQCSWHPLKPHTLGLTTSAGLARLVSLDREWRITGSLDLDVRNELEAWCIAFSPSVQGRGGSETHYTVYCGGDDSTLRYNTYSVGRGTATTAPSAERSSFSAVAIKGQHIAGVTAILPLSLHDQTGARLVVTGSYDDHVRLLAIHDLDETCGVKRVRLRAEENLGGGVWRLDLMSHRTTAEEDGGPRVTILASCMHAGSRIIELRRRVGEGQEEEWTFAVLARFEEHQSMNYGSAFMRSRQGPSDRLTWACVSTSFYDKLLCLWDWHALAEG